MPFIPVVDEERKSPFVPVQSTKKSPFIPIKSYKTGADVIRDMQSGAVKGGTTVSYEVPTTTIPTPGGSFKRVDVPRTVTRTLEYGDEKSPFVPIGKPPMNISEGDTKSPAWENVVKAYKIASIPAKKIGEGYKKISELIPEPHTSSTAVNVIGGLPKVGAEIAAEFIEGMYTPESFALMGAGKGVSAFAKTPAGGKVVQKVGELTTKYTPTLKKWLTYRFGVDPKFQALDEARKKAIDDAGEQAVAAGKSLMKGLSKGQQQRVGQILKGGTSTGPEEAPLREIAGQVRPILDAYEKKAVDLGLIPKEAPEAFKKAGQKYVPRLYRVFEDPKKYNIPEALLPYVDEMSEGQLRGIANLSDAEAEQVINHLTATKSPYFPATSKIKIGGERFKRRGNLSDAYKQALGEIKEPAYPVFKGVSQVGRDVANAQFFREVAANSDWVSETSKAGYKLVTNDKRKYGELAGKYLKTNLAEDMESVFKSSDGLLKSYEKFQSMWKFGKVVINPATHVRNVISNTIMLNQGGVGFTKMPGLLKRATSDLLGKGKYYTEAKENTRLLGKEFFGGEIQEFKNALFATGDEGVLGNAVRLTKRLGNKVGAIYQGEEQVYKMAMYIHSREAGMGIQEAAKQAEKWVFNYEKVSPLIQKLRSIPGGSPFITYTSKVLPRLAENVIKDPMKLYKYDILFDAVEKVSQRRLGLSDEDMATIKRTSYGTNLILPWKNEAGDPMVLDLSYLLPWGDLGETGGGSLSLPGGPVKAVLDVAPYNKSTFKARGGLGGEIYLPTDNTREKVAKIVDYLGKSILPPLTPGLPTDSSWFNGGYSFQKLANAVQKRPDYFNRVRDWPLVVLDTLAGIKINPVDPQEKAAFENIGKKKLIGILRTSTAKILRNPGVSEKYKEKILSELSDKIDEITRVGK